jgi:cytochrome oxidase Cu insertion factor (SCO1/SenC/PrrC family)
VVAMVVREKAAHSIPPLPVLGEVPDFSLIEANGQPLRRRDLQGRVWIASFIFTHCAGTCPIMTFHMKKLQAELPARDDLRLVSFTVDPDRDTPEVLQAYAKREGADTTRWLFLTGEKKPIHELAQKGFRLAVAEGQGSEEEPILHSTKFVLVDKQARIRGYYDGNDNAACALLVRDAQAILLEKQ